MTWFTDSNCQTESAKSHNLLAVAVDAAFPSGHVRLCSWLAPLTINGNVFAAAAGLGRMPDSAESVKLTATTRTYQLAGVDPSVVPESEIDNCFGLSFTEYLVWLDSVTYRVIGFEINFEGRMDKIARKDGGAIPVIEVNVEPRFVTLDWADGWTYTTQHQKQFFGSDTGFDHVVFNNSTTILWGGRFVAPGVPGKLPPNPGEQLPGGLPWIPPG